MTMNLALFLVLFVILNNGITNGEPAPISANATASAVVSAIEAGDTETATALIVEAIATIDPNQVVKTSAAIAEAIVAIIPDDDAESIAAAIATGDPNDIAVTLTPITCQGQCCHRGFSCFPYKTAWFKHSGGRCFKVDLACHQEGGYATEQQCKDNCF